MATTYSSIQVTGAEHNACLSALDRAREHLDTYEHALDPKPENLVFARSLLGAAEQHLSPESSSLLLQPSDTAKQPYLDAIRHERERLERLQSEAA